VQPSDPARRVSEVIEREARAPHNRAP
jgi:hypothetical protein